MIPKIKMLGKKVLDFVKKLWAISENRILIILIISVLTLLILAVILFFGIDWSNSVGICYREDTDPSNAAYRQALEQSLAQQGFQVIVTDADGDQARQLEQIRDLANRRCDAIVVEPVMVTAGEELSQALEGAGIPAVLIGSQLEESMMQIPYVGADATLPGTLQGQMVLSLPDRGDINGDGVVSYLVIQGSETDSYSTMLADGFAKYLSDGQMEGQMLTACCGDWTADGGMQACSEELAAYGKDIEVILCANDAMAIGAVAAIADGGRQVGEDVYLYGIGGQTEVLGLIQEGKMSGTVHTDIQQQVNAVLDGLLTQIGGQIPEMQYQPAYTAVTAENVQQFLPETEE